MKLFRGQQVGDFEIHAHLDTGGMAEVYLARNLGDHSLSVIKILHEEFREQPELFAMVQEEGRIMTRLRHPNIVQVLYQGEAFGLPYLALEYLNGDNLGVLSKMARKRKEQLSSPLIARIFLQVANALAYVHTATDLLGIPLNLVHRDISPQNILICYDGRIKLLDFGIAKSADRRYTTQVGMLKGKIRYMSPEQITGGQIDLRSDIFSCGTVLWESITGYHPARGFSNFEIMKLITDGRFPSPRPLRPDLPEKLETIVMRCLEPVATNRYADAGQLRQALSEYLFTSDDRGHPDELVRVTQRLLQERKQMKESFIRSIERESTLRNRLFGEMDKDLEEEETVMTSAAQPPGQAPDPYGIASDDEATELDTRAFEGHRLSIPFWMLLSLGALLTYVLLALLWLSR